METQPVLILQHSEGSPPGSTTQWLQKRKLPYFVHHYGKNSSAQPAIEIQNLSAFIICGGGMNVDQEQLYPWMKAEKKLIEQALKQKIPTVGLCLGAQMMAEVLGAKVGRHTCTEAGWHDIQIQPQSHPLLNFSPKSLRAFQWHSYAFETPKTAVCFAKNEATLHQGFIYENHALATQFHPEATWEWVKYCSAQPDWPSGKFCQSKDEILRNPDQQPILQDWYFQLLDRLILSTDNKRYAK